MKSVGFLICAVLMVAVRANFGPLRAVLYSDWITCDHKKDQELKVNDVQAFFYDFQNNMNFTDTIDRAADTITRAYNLDVTRRLILFVPGYKSHISRKTEELIRQTFSNVPNVYLIIIDHSAYTNARGGKLKSYETSVHYTYHIGKALGKFLADLKTKSSFPSKNIHCVGHSLGAQMLSHVGEYYTNVTTEKVWRITGIDPAGPCFSNSFINDQIRSGVGEYVEVYHCNAGGLGTTSVLADIDFFINGDGTSQPQCGSGVLGFGESDAAKCSHKACVRYWATTVNSPGFLAWRCDSYKEFSQGRCAGNEVTIAGYSNPGNATGVFYLSTGGR